MPTGCCTRLCRFCSCWLLLVLMATESLAGTVGGMPAPLFYDSAKEGWFWYQNPPSEKPEEEPVPLKEGQSASVGSGERKNEVENPSLDNYTTRDIWNLHPDQFQGLINGIQKKAVQNPTEKNILEYLALQDIARRKALAYSNATQLVNQKYSNLFNINQVYPVAAPGVSARVQAQQKEISGTILAAREDHAMLFFVDQGCGFCEKQAAILAYFVEQYGWQIKTVDIGQDSTIAAQFNISTTPTLLLIRQGESKSMPVAVGVVALSELERRLYQAIRYLGGETKADSFHTYDFQKGSALDPGAILKTEQPWKEQ